MDNNENEEKNKVADAANTVHFLWKNRKIVIPAAGVIASILGIIASVALVAALFSSVGTAFVESIFGWFTGAVDEIKSDFAEIGDTWDMLTTDYEKSKMEKAEKSYYAKLQSVYKSFKKKYGVEIDPTMITSTLFWGRTDEITGSEVDDASSQPVDDSSETKSWYEEQTELYKKAKANITKLAYYQLVATVTANSCVPKDDKFSGTKPETDKEIADNWVNPFIFDTYLLNIRTNYNYVDEDVAKADNKLGICPYDDAEPTLTAMYENDKNNYIDAQADYDRAYDDMIAEYDRCVDEHKNDGYVCDYDEIGDLAAERAALDSARAAYQWWIDRGLFDDNGTFSCVSTDKYGDLSLYDDSKTYRNYDIDTSILNPKSEDYNYSKSLTYFNTINIKNCNGEKCEDTNCSQKPSMNLNYSVELAREGVYYWRLLSYNEKAKKKEDQQSFIKSYYFPDEDVFPEDEIEQVENIYLNYQTWSDRQLNKGFGPFVCLDYATDESGAVGVGDPTTWKQWDSRWKGIALGNSTLGQVGCFVTSWSIQLALSFQADTEALMAATGCASVDPGNIAAFLAANNAFSSGGSLLTLEPLKSIFPGLEFGSTSFGGTMSQKADAFRQLLAEGKKPIVRVKYGDAGQHWVSVTGVDESGNIQIADPGYNKTTLSEWEQTKGVTLDVRYFTTG